MKTCIVSYGDYDYDGRLRGLYDVCAQLGEVVAFTRGSQSRENGHHVFQGSYFRFIQFAVSGMKKLGAVDLLLLDNRKSIVPGFMGKRYLKPQLVVLDCRELYIAKEVKHLAGKIGCLIEDAGVDRADCLIAANQDRAEFMKSSRNLRDLPLVYENLRRLNEGSSEDQLKAKESIQPLLKPDEIRIVSTGGCDPARLSLDMVAAMSHVGHPSRLYLVGPYTREEANAVRHLISELELDGNVEIVGRLSQAELKYLLDNAHIGLVGYHQGDLNNKYCASGKIYEYLYEGLPVVTSCNPPLERLCSEGVGVSGTSYAEGINQVIENYDVYRACVLDFVRSHSIEENDQALATGLLYRFEQRQTSGDGV